MEPILEPTALPEDPEFNQASFDALNSGQPPAEVQPGDEPPVEQAPEIDDALAAKWLEKKYGLKSADELAKKLEAATQAKTYESKYTKEAQARKILDEQYRALMAGRQPEPKASQQSQGEVPGGFSEEWDTALSAYMQPKLEQAIAKVQEQMLGQFEAMIDFKFFHKDTPDYDDMETEIMDFLNEYGMQPSPKALKFAYEQIKKQEEAVVPGALNGVKNPPNAPNKPVVIGTPPGNKARDGRQPVIAMNGEDQTDAEARAEFEKKFKKK